MLTTTSDINITLAFMDSINGNMTEGFSGITIGSMFIGVILAPFAVVTLLGNILVIIAVSRMRYLRSMTNYFIVSLAMADCLMGSIVMPFGVFALMTPYWPFGQIWCDLWHAFDVLSSTASILNLCTISLERYWATENPMTYPTKMTHRRCLMMVGMIWVCSSLISFPAIIWWRAVQTPVTKPECTFTEDSAYLLLSSTISFYIPLLVMLVVYWRIYRIATNLIRSMNSGTKVVYTNGSTSETMVLRIHRGGGGGATTGGGNTGGVVGSNTAVNQVPSMSSASSSLKKKEKGNTGSLISRHTNEGNGSIRNNNKQSKFKDDDSSGSTQMNSPEKQGNGGKCLSKKFSSFALGRRLTKFAKEQKAAKTLGIVMGVFIICWLPFFSCMFITAINNDALGVNAPTVWNVVTWLGYFNSSVNPFIYAHTMRDFRRAFIKILSSCCPHRNKSTLAVLAGVAAPRGSSSATYSRVTGNRSTKSNNNPVIGGSSSLAPKASIQSYNMSSNQNQTNSDISNTPIPLTSTTMTTNNFITVPSNLNIKNKSISFTSSTSSTNDKNNNENNQVISINNSQSINNMNQTKQLPAANIGSTTNYTSILNNVGPSNKQQKRSYNVIIGTAVPIVRTKLSPIASISASVKDSIEPTSLTTTSPTSSLPPSPSNSSERYPELEPLKKSEKVVSSPHVLIEEMV